ncbi:NAD(P)/FAD-dependent oxidoreductase [Paenibacillus arenilitoris]|uniref:FAD-binding oxidoreductase n=1 Tax=Paenibacillus arenilitoris TaxID=2772299 RepID=A0A927H8S1_9BACL|nr:FAD-dependent oxidoreductase [Paenibacillus arenilitoris]MBD2872360.1 FAD-binding oxidoreductase [Paenibacillus arenilitoris]
MTELYAGRLFWPGTLSHVQQYEPLRQNKKTQIAVIGGGMSGTTCCLTFARSGLPVVLLERDRVAGGTTLASTGMLQYVNDVMLIDLINQIGERDAVALYRSCRDSVNKLASMASALTPDVDLRRRSSLYYASTGKELPKLKAEYEALRSYGFDVEFWTSETIANHFPFRKPGAIVTHGDAELNPYKFVNAAAGEASRCGAEIHERTGIVSHETRPDGRHVLRTAEGFEVEAEHVVYAVGYEPGELRGNPVMANLNRTFVIVTDPQPDLQSWHQRFLIWETARPYLYMRTTADNRVIIGGLDEPPSHPVQSGHALGSRSGKLLQRLRSLFPGLSASAEYEWSATFGESRDSLPFIGEDPAWKNVYYCLGYGGNGTVYGMLAADMLRDLIAGGTHPLERVIGVGRRWPAGAK